MTSPGQWQRTLDAILALTDEIARLSPDCADRAMQIARLMRNLEPPPGESCTGVPEADSDTEPEVGALTHALSSQPPRAP